MWHPLTSLIYVDIAVDEVVVVRVFWQVQIALGVKCPQDFQQANVRANVEFDQVQRVEVPEPVRPRVQIFLHRLVVGEGWLDRVRGHVEGHTIRDIVSLEA